MSYFTAVMARKGPTWSVHDLDLDSAADLGELTAELRIASESDEPVLLLVEREDAWWAVVRVDGEEDPRIFVSDVAGVPPPVRRDARRGRRGRRRAARAGHLRRGPGPAGRPRHVARRTAGDV